MVSRIPMGRTGTIAEVAALVHYLVSAEASFCTASAMTSAAAGRRIEASRRRRPPEAVTTPMPERYWLVHPNGGRQLIDPDRFDLGQLAERAREVGGRLEVEAEVRRVSTPDDRPPRRFEPPASALGPIFPRPPREDLRGARAVPSWT